MVQRKQIYKLTELFVHLTFSKHVQLGTLGCKWSYHKWMEVEFKELAKYSLSETVLIDTFAQPRSQIILLLKMSPTVH